MLKLRRQASDAAYAAAGVNLIAAVAMLTVLRHGLPDGISSFGTRLAYARAHIIAWRVGWLAWNLAALTLLALYISLGSVWRERAPVLCRLAVLIAAAGVAADLSAESILMSAAHTASLERVALGLTGYVANGLYTVAGIALTLAGRRELPRALVALAVPVWGAGIALSVATLANSRTGELVSTAILMPLFIAWSALVGRWLRAS